MKISHIGAKISGLAVAGSLYLATASAVYAQGNFNTGDIGSINLYKGGLSGLISKLVNWGLGIVGIIAVIYLIYGGVIYITAGGDAEKAGKGRVAITNAIIGIIIIIAALAIYNAVVTQTT